MGRYTADMASPAFDGPKTRRACMSPVSSSDEDGDRFDFEPRKRSRSAKPPAKRAKTTKRSAAKKTRDAPAPFVAYLVESLKESVQAKLSFAFGFGLGSIIPLPTGDEWTGDETKKLAEWLESLGFTAHKSTNVYRISNKQAATLLKALQPTVHPSAMSESTKAYIHNFALPLDESLEFVSAPVALPPVAPSPAAPSPAAARPSPTMASNPRLHWGTSPILPARLHRHRLGVDPSPIAKISPQLDEHSLDVSFDVDDDDMSDVVVAKRISFGAFVKHAKPTAIVGGAISPIREETSSTDTSLPSRSRLHDASTDANVSFSLLNLSRDDLAFVQTKRQRNHQRRLSFFEHAPRRSSFFVPSTTVIVTPTVLPDAVATLVLSSGFLKMTPQVASVSKHWHHTCSAVQAWTRADYTALPLMEQALMDLYPRGQFLADGAYKRVYKVHAVASKHDEAMSVMDVRAIEALGNEHIVRQEIATSLLMSDLVASNVCPNFVRLYDVFLAGAAAPAVWGGPALPTDATGRYLYTRMELCDGGNVEDYLRTHGSLDAHDVAAYFFQMCFALYTGRATHALRHFDIKLLNFFLQSHDAGVVAYEFDGATYSLAASAWVKLADFGSATTQDGSLTAPIGFEHWTTYENAPIEFFVDGDDAVQGYAVDTFALGLCLLHLATGSLPYEELLVDVVCPKGLKATLLRLWKVKRATKGAPAFSILQKVLRRDASHSDVLCDTLYRYCVLFGLDSLQSTSRVATALRSQLLGKANARRLSPDATQFHADVAAFSLATGTHKAVVAARTRLVAIDGLTLLQGLVDFTPARRPSLKRVLAADIFATLRVATTTTPDVVIATYKTAAVDV
ncbi:serine/threonine protein kinase [Saprolegnia parasitica CBS 223.65]|uniref:Serine/threonine protein kinase n=1 Tax=Saprolegnia parasitica (strain CBS 223.65) TaxID=695850 RepID=A0A067CBI6_SAPPC|nr:serine/threonine protein kinase [Saprolegnia parasitica CBS 223.65]KDO28119.1 serine/threonine protein kinase [Saprolegnia parasitica CBS 223.65]|eukprot:XP_012201258.1 serine/threonine protein kinase [Saprolegnia parasitica CBS 223.65]